MMCLKKGGQKQNCKEMGHPVWILPARQQCIVEMTKELRDTVAQVSYCSVAAKKTIYLMFIVKVYLGFFELSKVTKHFS